MVDTGEIHRNSVVVSHKNTSQFVASILPDLEIRPYFQKDVPVMWRALGLLPTRECENPVIFGSSPLELIDAVYRYYVTNQPVIINKHGEEFQVTDDMTLTFGQEPYQRPFKETKDG